MATLLILPSPFLGWRPYEPLVAALRQLGVPADVATYDEPPVATALVARWREQASACDDVVLVPHSNAGLLAPSVAEGRPILFVDAALPAAAGSTPLAPAGFLAWLEELGDQDGLLPPWTQWWSHEELAGLLPPTDLDALGAVVPRVPLSYVESSIGVPAGWETCECGYLAFGSETYAAELERARFAGWPVRVLAGARHLHCLVAPEETAAALFGVLDDLGC